MTLSRKTPMARGSSTLKRTAMKPGTTPLRATAPMKSGSTRLRHAKPKSAKPKRAAREAEDRDLMQLCVGQPCYLLVPDVHCAPRNTVLYCHSNQSVHGKGKSLKAHNRFTVPGCLTCHAAIDQGAQLTRAEKFALWDDAYARWVPARARLLERQRLLTTQEISTAKTTA